MDTPVTNTVAHRLKELSECLEAFERQGHVEPLHVAGADPEGDDVARLAAQFQRLSERVARLVDALERSARQRRDLLTNVSHDLRTPLAAMQGYLELLLLRHANLDPTERHNYLETAARQSERLARLVGDLFQLAELDGDDVQPQFEDFALGELVQDVMQKYAPEAIRRQVGLHSPTGEVLGLEATFAVHADIGLTDKVLGNLVENGLRHTPPGGTVTIEIGRDADRARLAVRDTGEGIAAADLQGLFERYDRTERIAGASTTPHGGLGLAIARRIVQLHGGEMLVDSTVGLGTCVRFDLALAQRSQSPGSVARSASAPDLGVVPVSAFDEARLTLERSETARARAEADLRAVEQRYLLAVRGSQDGLWEWDLASDKVQLSPRWKSMLGFESHEISDDRAGWLARVHPDDRVRLDEALRYHASGGDTQPFDQDVRLLHNDGSIRHVLSRGVAIRDEGGVPYRIVGVDTDITRVKRMQTVLDALADGMADAYGDEFFPALVRNFARALDVELVFIAECVDEPPTRVRTLACWSRDRGAVDNFEFTLAGTPCEEVIQDGRSCFHREDLERIFPRERGYEAYLGMPIRASTGRVLGHLAFFDRVPRGDEMLVDSVYKIFIARAAAEMERAQAARP